jgi:hypothetical protein
MARREPSPGLISSEDVVYRGLAAGEIPEARWALLIKVDENEMYAPL